MRFGLRDGSDSADFGAPVLQRPGQVRDGLVAAGGACDDGSVEVCAELGQHRCDAVDRLPQAGGDGLAGPFGGAGPEHSGTSGESGGSSQLGDQRSALRAQLLRTSDVVVCVCGGQVCVELGETTPVGGPRGGVEQGSGVAVVVSGAGQFQRVHVGAGPSQQHNEVGQSLDMAEVGRVTVVADPPQLSVAAQLRVGAVRGVGQPGTQ